MTPTSTAAPAEGLVVVSNRLPYDLPREGTRSSPKRNVGGLVNALEPVLARRGGTWIGWDGAALPSTSAVQASLARPRSLRLPSGIALAGVPLSDRDVARYYHGLSNRALWPLFHDFPGKAHYAPEDWAAYVQVNRRFAEQTLQRTRRGDRIWVHDFHLTLVPGMLRELGFRGRIDFFLHIPFPPAEIFRALPWRDEVLRGMLASDAVVFHIDRYRRNFVEAARTLAGAEPSDGPGRGQTILLHERGAVVAGFEPIGIDVDDFRRLSETEEVRARGRRIRAAYGGRPIVFGADRLDYTKGVLERFLAVERYVRSHPSAAGSFVLVQVVVPSRHQVEEYRAMKREIDRQVGRINGELGADGWVPIHYRFKALDREELVAHYLASSVALVTPLRDGMNLVATEFVASRSDGDGVLVLSEFAGIAEYLAGAVPVNPNDLERFGSTIGQALAMPESERRRRMARMRPFVDANPASAWAERCLAVGTSAPAPHSPKPRADFPEAVTEAR